MTKINKDEKHTYFIHLSIIICFFLLQVTINLKAQLTAEKGLPFITNYSPKDYHAHPQNWAIIQSDQGIMYFGNSTCLLEYNGVKWRKLTLGANNALIRSVAKDKQGLIYFGSYAEFGYLAPDSLGNMQLQSLIKYIPKEYRNFTDIFSIYVTDEGIYFQSRERIFRLKHEKNTWNAKVWEAPTSFMYAFYLDGIYYVHQRGVGLFKMINDKLIMIPGSGFLANERTQVMLPYSNDKNGNKQYLLGLFYTGLYLFNGKTFTHFSSEADSLFKTATLYRGALLNDGNYALSTTGKGLVIMNAQGKIIQLLNRETGLQDESVYNVFTDRKGTLWLGLDNGISRVETNSPFTQFTIQSGITNAVLAINRFEGSLYLGTPNSDGTYALEDTRFLAFMDRSVYCMFPENDSICWFATNEGLIKYNEHFDKNDKQLFKTLITSVTAGQKALNTNNALNVYVDYKNNALRFEYAAPFFDQENKTQYQTWLESFEPTWSDYGSNYYKEYTNLHEGKYIFHVRAKNIYRKVSEEAVYTFTVQPPWFKSWWAYILYAVAVLLTLWLIIAWRVRVLNKEKLLLEKKVALRTHELQAEKSKVESALSTLTSTQAQLIQSEKMASLGELTAGIAHEIQNPLNFVNNFADVNKELLDELKNEADKGNIEEVKAIANDIKNNEEKINHHGKRAEAIVKGMLQHSRQTKGVKEPTDINALCDEYLRLSYHGLRAKDKNLNADFRTDFDESIRKINIVQQDFGRVLLNLLNNAFYAVNEKKKTADENYKPMVSIQTKKLSDKIEINVRDNGNGIPQSIIDKIFQPFFTTKPTGQGTGLGLSLSYDIITKEHNGTVTVKSKEREGSEFIIQLPC